MGAFEGEFDIEMDEDAAVMVKTVGSGSTSSLVIFPWVPMSIWHQFQRSPSVRKKKGGDWRATSVRGESCSSIGF